jgi:hypothetical protein
MSASILDPKGITAANVAVAPTLPDIMPQLPLADHWSC